MSLSLKAELETWAAALKAYDEQDFEKALDLFSRISDSSKILTNMGLIYATIGEHETAVEHFVAATNLDAYLAIAYFQCGVSNFILERYDLALLNFQDAYLYLRGNETINYEQIGLKFKLFSAEILFNKGLARLNLGYVEEGMANMREASNQKVTNEHAVIDEAIRDRGEGYTVFSIPVGILYRPSENKLKNSKTKDYLGKAKLVAASDANDAFTEFTGVKKLRQASGENNGEDQKNPNAKSFVLDRSISALALSTESNVPRPTTLERSKTTLQPAGGIRPDTAAILAPRRAQSVSSPANVPPPPRSGLTRSNTAQSRSNTPRLARSNTTSSGGTPLRAKTPQETAGQIVGVGAGGETGAALPTAPMTLRSRPSLLKPHGQGAPQAPQQSAPQSPPQSLQHVGQYVNAMPGVTPLVLPATPVPAQEGYLTQIYDTYLDVYSDEPASYSTISPTSQAQSGVSSSQRLLPASTIYQQPQPQEQQQLPAWMANIRIKLHYQGDVRGMTIPPTTSFNEFVERVTTKFGTSLMGLGMKFTDEEGTKISLRDQGDFELAIETARENAKGRSEGKIEVWCVDL